MRHSVAIVVAFVLLGVFVVVQAQSKRDWQVGTWRDTSSSSETVGAVTSGTGAGAAVRAFTTPIRRRYQLYVIETPDFIYHAEQRLRWRRSKGVPMTVNDDVTLAIEGEKVYVIGENRKEYKLSIIKKIRKAK